MSVKSALKNISNAELLSYIINVTPELRDDIDLPVQGQSIMPIGQIIVNNERYRNAFIKTINLIGLTVIKRNGWENPWEGFTNRGTLSYGQTIREMVLDLCNVYDYNEKFEDTKFFLENEVPNVFQYLHELNFQKVYKTTSSDNQIRMAFINEDGLFDFVDEAIAMLYESYKYDSYIIDKYQLCRRILDGTITPIYIDNYDNLTERQRVSALKKVANKMTFRNPNFNPAGVSRANSFKDLITIINTDFEADFSTEVLATSYYRNEAELKTNMALIDGFDNHDTKRLTLVLKSAYKEFTKDELTKLANVKGVVISREFFMDYIYALDNASGEKNTEFYNPGNMTNNHFLHVWKVFSTSPFEQAGVITSVTPSVTSVTVAPQEVSVSAGLGVQFNAVVKTEGFANKAVVWKVTKGQDKGAIISNTGYLTIPDDFASGEGAIEVSAISVFDNTKIGKATVTVL